MMANPETVAEVDTSLGKIIFLSLVSILLAALSGYLLLAAFQNGEARSYFWAIMTLCLFLAAFVLHTLLIKYFQTQVLIIILESAALTAFFLQPFIKFLSIVTLTLWSVGMLFLIWGAYAGYQYLQSNLKIKFFQLATRTLRGASTGLAIILVILYIAFYGTQGIPLSQGTVQLFLRTMQPFAQRYVASFSLDLTINDLFREIIISNLSDEELKKLNTLPPTLRNAFLERSAAEIRAGIGQYIDISNVNGNDKIPDAFYKFIVEKFAKSSRSLQTTIFSGAGILLFLMFRTAIWLLTLVASFVSFLIYEIMMVTGFARVSLETRSKEVVLMQ